MKQDKIKRDLVKIYDDLAGVWTEGKGMENWGLTELKEFAKLVGSGGKVLDLGCGAGVQANQLKREGLVVVGLDLSPKMIEIAKRSVKDCKFIVGDLENLNFETNTFDGVYARASLLHIRKQKILEVLKSIFHILGDKGVLYLALKEGEGEKFVEAIKYGKKVKRFFSFFTNEEISDYLVKAGFKVLSSHSWNKDDVDWIHIFAIKV